MHYEDLLKAKIFPELEAGRPLSLDDVNNAKEVHMKLGWQTIKGVTYFNPKLYREAFNKAFAGGGKIW